MGMSTRDYIKRHLVQSLNDIDRCMSSIAKAGSYYEADHKEIFDKYCTLIAFIESCKVIINQYLAEI